MSEQNQRFQWENQDENNELERIREENEKDKAQLKHLTKEYEILEMKCNDQDALGRDVANLE